MKIRALKARKCAPRPRVNRVDAEIAMAVYRAVRDRDMRSLHILRALRSEIVEP